MAHGAFNDNALNANEMNVKPGGKQCVMHSTIIPDDNPNPHLWGQVQLMIFNDDLTSDDPNYEFCGQPKGMKRVLEERGIWDELVRHNSGKPIPGDCAKCKMSQKEKEKQAREAAESMAGQDKEEGTDKDIHHELIVTGKTCCMQRVLMEQQDFCSEKPLLQLVIERTGHKCYFLPKFHCELNPIEMYWGWAKKFKFCTKFLIYL